MGNQIGLSFRRFVNACCVAVWFVSWQCTAVADEPSGARRDDVQTGPSTGQGVPAVAFGEISALGDSQQPAMQQPGTKRPAQDILELPIERLAEQPVLVPALQQPVTTVSRQESTVGQSPAAVFVVTNDMIRRSGATSVMEVLRMVPGVNVARIDANAWAISSRGFNDRFAGKMLVQIDGRSVYSPVTSGVFWDVEDLLLQDVDRIEVIRGPGASVWGANALNGIINIITKQAKDTQGGLIFGGGGTEERGFSGFRYGAKCGDDMYYRVWGKWFERDNGFNPDGEAHDDWRQGRGGFRIDWEATDCDVMTVQSDLYDEHVGRFDRRPTPFAPFVFSVIEDQQHSGEDVLWRWTHREDKDSDWRLQLYYDRFERHSGSLFAFDLDTLDLDFQQQFPLTCCQQFIYGFGYRFHDLSTRATTSDNGFPFAQIAADPPDNDSNLFTAFVQDQITLVDDWLYFTVGSKFEHNDFTGFEYQPTGRVLLTPSKRQSAWAAVSRAVRTPNFQEDSIVDILGRSGFDGAGNPIFPFVVFNRGFESEDAMAYELGYRAQPTDAFSWDIALFFNDYNNLRVTAPRALMSFPGPPPFNLVPLKFQNEMDGETYGVELSANWKLTDCWRLYGAYTFLQMQLHADESLPAATRAGAEAAEGQSPQNQVYLQSSWDLPCHLEFDLIGRFIDNLPGFDPAVDSYIELDVRLGWKPTKNLQLAVVGQNLLDSHHLEFGANPLVGFPLVEAERGVYGMMEWRF